MNKVNEHDISVRNFAASSAETSVSLGLNIYRFSKRNIEKTTNLSVHKTVTLPYGSYMGGDISIGGGEPVSLDLDRWLAEP